MRFRRNTSANPPRHAGLIAYAVRAGGRFRNRGLRVILPLSEPTLGEENGRGIVLQSFDGPTTDHPARRRHHGATRIDGVDRCEGGKRQVMTTFELLSIIGSIAAVGIALAAVVIGSNANLRTEMRTDIRCPGDAPLGGRAAPGEDRGPARSTARRGRRPGAREPAGREGRYVSPPAGTVTDSRSRPTSAPPPGSPPSRRVPRSRAPPSASSLAPSLRM